MPEPSLRLLMEGQWQGRLAAVCAFAGPEVSAPKVNSLAASLERNKLVLATTLPDVAIAMVSATVLQRCVRSCVCSWAPAAWSDPATRAQAAGQRTPRPCRRR